MEKEIWKDIPGYEGRYQISNIGRVRGLPHAYVCGNNTTRYTKELILKTQTDQKGYARVRFERRTFKVHRLVAIAFIPNPNNYPQVNHINGNKQDNRVENLEWCNNSMNQKHAWANGFQKSKYKKGRKVKMTNIKTGAVLIFDSIRQASAYFGGRPSYASIIWKNISNWYGFQSFKGFIVEGLTPARKNHL